MSKITTLGIDLAKRVFQVAAEDARGVEQPIERSRFTSREAFAAYLGTLAPPLRVGMETGPGAQAWARLLQSRGIDVQVLPAQRVAEHRSGAKNDANDARAILRALRDTSIHPVPVKSVEQLTMQALHRARQGWMARKTALGNQMRGLLLEHGVTVAQGDAALCVALARVPQHELVPQRLRDLIEVLWDEWQAQVARIAASDLEFKALARQDPLARRLDAIAGIGPLTATALACKGLEPGRFRNARMFAAYFGVVPDQHSSGEKIRLGRMSKRGDGYVRQLLINGAHAVVRVVRHDATDALSRRVLRWRGRHGVKGAAVRLANHNLRVVWAMLKNQTSYRRGAPMTTN